MTYQSQTTSVPLVHWNSKLKNPNCLKLSENRQSTLRAACTAARHPTPEHTEGWHTQHAAGTHGLPVQGWGWADTVSQWSAFSKRHSLSVSPKSSWEVQCQFYLEKARLQGLFSPLCCTVPRIKYSAPIPNERTILVFLPTNCPYLMTNYKRAWRELW